MSTSLLVQALAKLGELAASLGTAINNIAGVQNTANAIRTDVTNARDNVNVTTNAARDNVKSHVTAVVAGIAGKPPVYGVQSGTAQMLGSATSVTVSIAAVQPRACLVEVSMVGMDGSTITSVYAGHTLNGDSLTIRRSGSPTGTHVFGWRIIEFYI